MHPPAEQRGARRWRVKGRRENANLSPLLSKRASGVLLHLTSLPGAHGSGDLGPSSARFLDFLHRAEQRWWQMLPVGPTGYGNSPYSAQSAFAGGQHLVALEPLVAVGLLSRGNANRARAPSDRSRVDFEKMEAARDTCLRDAFEVFERSAKRRRSLDAFVTGNRSWLADYALFRALKVGHSENAWTTWPAALRRREPEALERASTELRRETRYHSFVQMQFAAQWSALRERATALGIGLIGDMPLYVACDSADVWANQQLFELDELGAPTKVAGVPPDYFSETGQRWGNPIYAWKRHRKSGFAWWAQRFLLTLSRFDVVRLDHFIGYHRYWEIPSASPTAIDGKWRPAPGRRLLRTIEKKLRQNESTKQSRLPLIAEDLGAVTPGVIALRDHFKLPGTKILQFAFGTDPSAPSFLPHNYARRSVVYTGTHDNETTAGWFEGASDEERRAALAYLDATATSDVPASFVRAALASVAAIAITPLQDVLGLGRESRMNVPGTTANNWGWRVNDSELGDGVADHLALLTRTYGRAERPR